MSPVMLDHINEPSTNQDTITIIKTARTNTKTLKPLGNMSRFPREIRDEIYRHVFSNTYKAFYSSLIFRRTFDYNPEFSRRVYNKREKRTESNMSILRLSKAIK